MVNVVVISILLLLSSVSYAEEKNRSILMELPQSLSWLKLNNNDKWQVNLHPDQKNWLRITPEKNNSTYKILAVVSKKSNSYKLALNKLLDTFSDNGIEARIDVVNINKKKGLVDSAMIYAEDNNFDLIFSIGSNSEGILHENYKKSHIPIVTSTNKDPVLLGHLNDYSGDKTGNIAYTSLNVPLNIQMNYIKTLKPNLRAIALMYNENHKQVMATEVIPVKDALIRQGISIVDISVTGQKTAVAELDQRMPDALNELKKIDPGLENTIYWITSSTSVFSNLATINKYSNNIPVLSSIPNAVKEGGDSAVIAIGIDRRSNAHMAALYAVDILKNNKKASELAVGIVTPPDISINFKVAKKIGLKIPFRFVESASFIYDYHGKTVRDFGNVVNTKQVD